MEVAAQRPDLIIKTKTHQEVERDSHKLSAFGSGSGMQLVVLQTRRPTPPSSASWPNPCPALQLAKQEHTKIQPNFEKHYFLTQHLELGSEPLLPAPSRHWHRVGLTI